MDLTGYGTIPVSQPFRFANCKKVFRRDYPRDLPRDQI